MQSKKENLFKAGNITQWQITLKEGEEPYNYEELIKNKELAFSKMCTQETRESIGFKKIYGYYMNRVIREYQRMIREQGKRFRKHFEGLSIRNQELLADSFHLLRLITFSM